MPDPIDVIFRVTMDGEKLRFTTSGKGLSVEINLDAGHEAARRLIEHLWPLREQPTRELTIQKAPMEVVTTEVALQAAPPCDCWHPECPTCATSGMTARVDDA